MLFIVAAVRASGDGGGSDEEVGFTVEWKEGFRVESADGQFKLKFGGRLQNDWMWGSGDDELEDAVGEIVSGNEFRRARLFFSGTVFSNVEFKVQYDFTGGDVDFKDVYLGITNLPFGTLRIGHFKEPFSLEELTSSKYLTFLERSLPNIFSPSRNTGFAILGHSGNERLTWGAGVFTDADDYGEAKSHGDTYNFSARVTFLPWLEGSDLLHVGFGYHYQGIQEGGGIRYRQRPEVHLTHRFLDTRSFAANSANIFGVEGALVYGLLSLQGEVMTALVDAPDYGDPNLNGYYVYGSFFLTPGDHRRYKKSTGAFDRVRPSRPFMPGGGTGAWEVAVRYSHLELSDGLIEGGILNSVSVALNWYLNSVTRFMFNYVYADREDVGSANFFQSRFQIDF